MKKIVLSLFVATSLIACSDDENTTTETTQNYSSGYLITNEGIFNSNNADVTYISSDFLSNENQLFRKVNNRALGDVAQSIAQNSEYVFVVMNNSNTIEVVKKNTFQTVTTITQNINQPRYATISSNKLWVTNAGNNTVTSYNLSDFSASNTITLDFTPEYIESTPGYILISTNPWAETNKIETYSTDTNQLAHSREVDAAINGLLSKDNLVYALASDENITQIYELSGQHSLIRHQTNESNSRFISLDEDKLYYTTGVNINQYDILSQTHSTLFSVPDTGWSAIYGFNVYNQQFFVADAKSFSEAGEIVIYNANGQAQKTVKTGIGPNGIYKIQ